MGVSYQWIKSSIGVYLLAGLALLAIWLALPACSPGTTITRDRTTYIAEQYANLARQSEAADALLRAAQTAKEQGGQLEECVIYAEPALLIYAVAEVQTYRALWLAGLPYPDEDGNIPEIGTVQPDPGIPGERQSAEEWCRTP